MGPGHCARLPKPPCLDARAPVAAPPAHQLQQTLLPLALVTPYLGKEVEGRCHVALEGLQELGSHLRWQRASTPFHSPYYSGV